MRKRIKVANIEVNLHYPSPSTLNLESQRAVVVLTSLYSDN